MKRVLGVLYIGLSLLIGVTGLSAARQRTLPVSVLYADNTTLPNASEAFAIRIPSAGIDLPVYDAHIVNGAWQTTTRGVSYLATSPPPGSRGNSVFYGHNWPNLLGRLTDVRAGDLISVTKGTRVTMFMVRYTAVVDGTDTSVYRDTDDVRITLYTCTGFLDRKRFVVTAFKV